MKNTIFLLAASGFLTMTSQADGVFPNQQLMVNPFMTESMDGWIPTAPWRNNATADQVFEFSIDGPVGFFSTRQDTVNLTTVGDHLSDNDFDPATSRLSSLSFNGVFLSRANEGAAGAGLAGKFFIEFDILTPRGTYRAKSNTVVNPWAQEPGVVLGDSRDYTWQDGDFLGDPFADGGVILSEITEIKVNYFMEVTKDNNGNGTVFVTIDNASIEYAVTTVAVP